MTRAWRSLGWIALLLLLSGIASLYKLVPSGSYFKVGPWSFIDHYTGDWPTSLWLLSITAIPLAISITLLFIVPKILRHWQIMILLGFVILYCSWNLFEILQDLMYVEDGPIAWTVSGSILLVGVLFAALKRRQKDVYQKNEELYAIIDGLKARDLPAFYNHFNDINWMADAMRETDLVSAWRVVLKEKVEASNTDVIHAIRKLENVKR